MKKCNSFVIVSNELKDVGFAYSRQAGELITKKGCKVKFHEGINKEPDADLFDDADAVIVMGGDGTMLRVSHLLKGKNIPVIGINLGKVGFLTEAVADEMENVIDRLIAGDYKVEQRIMLKGRVIQNSEGTVNATMSDNQDVKVSHALNDIVLARKSALRLITVEIYVNGNYFDTCEADGIMVSTPTGSTGYNLSAGGPIVKGDARLMVLTPISPFSLSRRSVIFGAEDVITMKILKKREDALSSGLCSFDGADNYDMEVGSSVEIRVSSHTFSVIKLDDASLYEILRQKIGG
ncbi:MAG: NAD(+)/NADH kinase [Eubacterium sp.]|nr:NAD(+)/NADH kinase [Eubacterium sp.]